MRAPATILPLVIFAAACTQTGDWAEPQLAEIPNPAAPGARYPFAATTADAEMMALSWLEPAPADQGPDDMKLVWASFDGEIWSTPELITSGDGFFVNWADFPSLAGFDGAPVAAHWLQKVPGGTYAYHVNMVFRSRNGTWSEPLTPHMDRSATEHGFVSLVPVDEDRVFAIWLDGYKMQGTVAGDSSHDAHGVNADLSKAMTLRSAMIHRDGSRGEELEVDSAVCDCCQTSAVRSGDHIIAVYRNRTSGEIRDIYRAAYDLDDGQWREPVALSHEGWEIAGCPVNGPQLSAFDELVIAAWFTAVDHVPRSYMAVSRDGGLTFSEPEPLDDGTSSGRVAVTFNREGTALLTWIEPAHEVSFVYGQLWRSDALGNSFVIGRIDPTRASGFPRVGAVGNDFLVAWTAPGSESRLRTYLVSPPRE